MSTAYTDLPSPAPSPVQIGAKQISYPFQGQGDYYARIIKRNMVQTPAANYAPIIGTLTSYTNLLTYSEDFSNAAWTKNDATFTANSVANPADGLVTCGKLLENATTAVHSISRTLTLTAAPSNVSIIAKPISRNYIQLAFVDSAATTFSGFFNLATGAAGTLSAGVTANIIPLANSFYRASIHFTPAAGAGTVKAQISTDGATTSYAGDAAKGLYLWGMQALTGTSPGPYVSTAANTRAVSAPPVDSNAAGTIEDPFAYLIKETEPEPGPLDLGTARWQRMAARVPADVVSGGSRVITKPAPSSFGTSRGLLYQVTSSGLDVATSLGTSYDYSNTVFANNQAFALKVASSTLTQPSGGTFTLTYRTSTTAALAYNAANATINAAINALADVVSDGLTFSATNSVATWPLVTGYIQLAITVGSTTNRVTMNAASLTPAGAAAAFTYVVSGTVQQIYIAARSTITAHGFTSTSDLAVYGSPGYYLLPDSQWNVIDANTVTFNWGIAGNNYTSASIGQYSRDYTPGTDRVLTQNTQRFYLPGVTSGITTFSDIPAPTILLNDLEFIAAVIANTSGYVTYDATELTRWMDSAIYTQTFEAINMSNV